MSKKRLEPRIFRTNRFGKTFTFRQFEKWMNKKSNIKRCNECPNNKGLEGRYECGLHICLVDHLTNK